MRTSHSKNWRLFDLAFENLPVSVLEQSAEPASSDLSAKILYFRLMNRLIIPSLEPSESYTMTLTLKSEGVNFRTRVKTFEVHLYPSDVVISNVVASYHELAFDYITVGDFAVSIRKIKYLKLYYLLYH